MNSISVTIKTLRMKSLKRDMQEYQIEHQLMTSYGTYLIMGFILQNPIKSVLHLTAVLSMLVDLSTKTNQIIGILVRFRQGNVVFVPDIEKTFFQVLVSKEHRSLLHFLWWQDSNLSKKLIDYEMCVHVFDGTSSPSCSNYDLKRTSIDGEDQFGKAAAETLQDNFYVDDLLKSLDNEREAMKFIKNVKVICASGGFKLNNFLSNSVDGADRKQGVKSKDLMGDLPAE